MLVTNNPCPCVAAGKRTGLPPGAWDRESTLPATKTSRREKELTERKGYLKNFW
jgi:hypothetical protein